MSTLHLATPEARRGAVAELVKTLGDGWTAEEPDLAEDGLPVVHRATGLRFVAVPGGRFDMGLSAADLEEASEYIDWTSTVAATARCMAEVARPVHAVRVRPFVCARTLLDSEWVSRLSQGRLDIDAVERDDARSLARALGLRLPSEAELEWLARDGGRYHFTLDAARGEKRSRFGVDQLLDGEWAEDDWHPSYDGAPSESAPWNDGDPCGVYRSGYSPEEMQSNGEMLLVLAATRGKGTHLPTFVGMRLALQIPE